MTNKELNINDALYTVNGDEVRVVERTDEFYLIKRVYVDDFGEIEEGQEEIFRDTLYKNPPQVKYHKSIKKLKEKITELESTRLDKSAKLCKEKQELEDTIEELQKTKEAYPCFEQVSLMLQILHNNLSTKCYMFVESTLEILEVESTNDILKKLKGSAYYGLEVQLKTDLNTKLDKTKGVQCLIKYRDDDGYSWETTSVVVAKNLNSLNLYVANLLSEWLNLYINGGPWSLRNAGVEKELILSKLDCFDVDENLKSKFKTRLRNQEKGTLKTLLSIQKDKREAAAEECARLEAELKELQSDE